MQLAHVIELDPSDAQKVIFVKAAGCARFAFNWALAEWQRQYKMGNKPNWMQLQKDFVSRIDAEWPWLREVPSTAYNQPFRHLNQAYKRFFKKIGPYPRFKHRRGGSLSFKLTNIRQITDRYVHFPAIGRVAIKESPRFAGRVISATVSADADRWTISILFELPDNLRENITTGTIGVDLGLKCFATLSDGRHVEAPKPLKASLTRLRRRSRILSRKQKGSKRRAKAKMSVARLHRRIRNIRRSFLHPLSTSIVRENQTIVLEDLNVKGMTQNRCLSRAIADVGWSEFKRQITYKAILHGRSVYVADQFFPSSKTCSSCGAKNKALTLADRTFICPTCGFTMDRDLNAAINLRTLVQRGTHARGELRPLVVNGIVAAKPARGNVNSDGRRKTTEKLDEVSTLSAEV